MPYRTWLLLLAAFIACLWLKPDQSWAQQSQKADSEEVTVPPPLFWLSQEPDESDRLSKPCAEGQDDRQSDLCAQWKAADAAQQASNWSIGLGLSGLVVAVLTLSAAGAAAKFARDAAIHTKTGADEARRSADAADTAIEVTREIGVAQIRAYVAIDVSLANKIALGQRIAFKITFTNKGNTFARDCVAMADAFILDHGHSQLDATKYKPVTVSDFPSRALSPSESRSFEYVLTEHLTEEDISRILNSQSARAWVAVKIRYMDIFANIRETELLANLVYEDLARTAPDGSGVSLKQRGLAWHNTSMT